MPTISHQFQYDLSRNTHMFLFFLLNFQVGMEQQYDLGQLLKKRYVEKDSCDGLICSNYTTEQVSNLTGISKI